MTLPSRRTLGYGLPFLSAGLWALSFPMPGVPEAAYLFLLPALAWLFFKPGWKAYSICGYLAGVLGWMIILRWLPSFTEHLNIPLGPLVGWGATFLLSCILSLFWISWLTAARFLLLRVMNEAVPWRILACLVLPALWVVLEWLRGWVSSGFPWLPLSASQWQRPLLLQISSITGAWGVSYLLVLFNLGLFFYLPRLFRVRKLVWWKRLSPEFYLALAALCTALAVGMESYQTRGKSVPLPRMVFIQPNVPGVDKWTDSKVLEVFGDLERLTQYASILEADWVFWPETPTPLPVIGNHQVEEWCTYQAERAGVHLIMGNIAKESGEQGFQLYNGVFHIDPERGLSTEYYRKRHLVPFGEYVPDWLFFLEKVVPLEGQFVEGHEPTILTIPLERETIDLGPLVCFEDIFPGLARKSVKAGADLLFVVTNNAWFGEGAGAYQHAAHSVLRAVETRRPVFRCGNAGWSGWIDAYGSIRYVMTDEDDSIYFQGAAPIDPAYDRSWRSRQTPYVKYGDWFVALCAGLVLLGGPLLRSCLKIPLSD